MDIALSQRWRRLWKWYIGAYLALFAGIFVTLLSAWLGLLVMTAATVGSLVVAILKLVYLWRTTRTSGSMRRWRRKRRGRRSPSDHEQARPRNVDGPVLISLNRRENVPVY